MQHMSLRIRSQQDRDIINKVQERLGETTASRAIFAALADYPTRLDQVDQLRQDIKILRRKIDQYVAAGKVAAAAVEARDAALADLLTL